MASKTIELGDFVSAINEAISGVVIGVGDQITIESSEGFPMKFTPDELVVEPKKWLEAKDFNGLYHKKSQDKTTTTRPKSMARRKTGAPPIIIDLHIEKLTKNHNRLAPWEILDFQMESARNQLEWAINKRKQRIIFIHGIGEGVLKAELETLFRRYDNIRFYPANAMEFGAGAIEVYRLQN